MAAELHGVPVAALDAVWPTAAPLLAKALEHDRGNYSLEDFRQAIEQRDAQLWLLIEDRQVLAAGITEICVFPQRKVCRIRGLGGAGLDRWAETRHDLEGWAAALGCDAMEFHGRPGWRRALPDYEQTAVVMEKRLQAARMQ